MLSVTSTLTSCGPPWLWNGGVLHAISVADRYVPATSTTPGSTRTHRARHAQLEERWCSPVVLVYIHTISLVGRLRQRTGAVERHEPALDVLGNHPRDGVHVQEVRPAHLQQTELIRANALNSSP